jgi:hypothetical protein
MATLPIYPCLGPLSVLERACANLRKVLCFIYRTQFIFGIAYVRSSFSLPFSVVLNSIERGFRIGR